MARCACCTTRTVDGLGTVSRLLWLCSLISGVLKIKRTTKKQFIIVYKSLLIYCGGQRHGFLLRCTGLRAHLPPPRLPAKRDDGLPSEQPAVRSIPHAPRESLHHGGPLPKSLP